jgi:hypothetical protein
MENRDHAVDPTEVVCGCGSSEAATAERAEPRSQGGCCGGVSVQRRMPEVAGKGSERERTGCCGSVAPLATIARGMRRGPR